LVKGSLTQPLPRERLQWVGTGLSRPPLNFQPGNLLCWLDRLDSVKSGPSLTSNIWREVSLQIHLVTSYDEAHETKMTTLH
jgi:hypothetical protein